MSHYLQVGTFKFSLAKNTVGSNQLQVTQAHLIVAAQAGGRYATKNELVNLYRKHLPLHVHVEPLDSSEKKDVSIRRLAQDQTKSEMSFTNTFLPDYVEFFARTGFSGLQFDIGSSFGSI